MLINAARRYGMGFFVFAADEMSESVGNRVAFGYWVSCCASTDARRNP
jgi:hypothetical protein